MIIGISTWKDGEDYFKKSPTSFLVGCDGVLFAQNEQELENRFAEQNDFGLNEFLFYDTDTKKFFKLKRSLVKTIIKK